MRSCQTDQANRSPCGRPHRRFRPIPHRQTLRGATRLRERGPAGPRRGIPASPVAEHEARQITTWLGFATVPRTAAQIHTDETLRPTILFGCVRAAPAGDASWFRQTHKSHFHHLLCDGGLLLLASCAPKALRTAAPGRVDVPVQPLPQANAMRGYWASKKKNKSKNRANKDFLINADIDFVVARKFGDIIV